ncbi:MAG: glycine--tRNA ligase subunit beta [Litoreibacter sp.]
MPDLLIELFSEEIPARMQTRAFEDLKKLVTDGLVDAGLTYVSAAAFSTPRRLTLMVEGVLAESPTTREERKGPRTDAPEKALEGFLRSTGLNKDQLEARDDKKGQVWFAVLNKPGRPAAEIVAETLEKTIRTFPWPKSMRWGTGTLRWVRPLHRILCILDDEAGTQVVPLDIDGIVAADKTEGHRFMSPGEFSVTSFDDYEAKLKRSKVMLRPDERRDAIMDQMQNQAFAQGVELVEDAGLLHEVAGLVEWPVVLMGKIDEEFLDLPPEVLKTSMKEHQKFFSIRNPKTTRIEQYVTVANVETDDNGATILAGNGRVLSARLADAKFFWENDLRVAKAGMGPWIDGLEKITFHNKLGSVKDKVGRIAVLARKLAPIVLADQDMAEKAAKVAKADLNSEMIYEFPDLQGLMGRYYSTAAGFSTEVAAACQEHYSPLGPSDDVPTAPVSIAVALADKIDTLMGFWAIEEKPTGSKDPFALRRAALGVIRLILTNDVKLPLLSAFDFGGVVRALDQASHDPAASELATPASGDSVGENALDAAAQDTWAQHGENARDLSELNLDLLSFFHDRLKVFLKDKGIRHDVIDACIAMPGNDDLALLVKRAEALSDVLKTDDGENLLQGFKRANNILAKEEAKDGVSYELDPNVKFAESDAEKALFAALDKAEEAISPAIEAEDFAAAMAAMATLRTPIDAFFDAVQVNSDNDIIRRNRLCLLHKIRAICGGVADLTKIEG